MSRSAILSRLQQINRADHSAPEGIAPRQRTTPDLDRDQLVEMFISGWEQLGGTWEQHENPTAARLAFLLFLRELDIKQIMTWSTDHLPLPDLREAIMETGIKFVSPNRRDLDPEVVLGLSGVDAALASSASLILVPASGRSWLPALFPIRFVTLIPISRLHIDLEAWQRQWQEAGRGEELCRSLIITGPSYSRDIELHPHGGMFGPRLMHAFLIDDMNSS